MRCLKIAAMVCVLSSAAGVAVAQLGQGILDEKPGSSGLTDAASQKSVVAIEGRFTAPTADRPGYLFVTAVIDPGWHIYSITQPTSPDGNPTVTEIKLKLPQGVRLAAAFRPKSRAEKEHGTRRLRKAADRDP